MEGNLRIWDIFPYKIKLLGSSRKNPAKMRYSRIDVVLTAACFAIQPGRSDIIATAAAALSVSPAFGIRDREWDGTGRRDLSSRLPPARDLTSYPSLPVQDSATRTAPGALAGGRPLHKAERFLSSPRVSHFVPRKITPAPSLRRSAMCSRFPTSISPVDRSPSINQIRLSLWPKR